MKNAIYNFLVYLMKNPGSTFIGLAAVIKILCDINAKPPGMRLAALFEGNTLTALVLALGSIAAQDPALIKKDT